MPRTENDSWDLSRSVGATATGVAVGRALASRGPAALIDDPYAAPLVRAVGVDFFTRLVDGELNPGDVDGDALFGMSRMTDMMGVRTRFFDDFFLNAARGAIHQAVILAAGLDARAYRLPWPSGTTVYEIDQPLVVDFKTRTMQELGAASTADRRTVAIDLRHDWPAALRKAGFDPGQPTAWSAEGLLAFLPPEAQDRLLDNITALSAPGSRFAAENMGSGGDAGQMMQDRMHEAIDRWREHGFDVDMTDLWYPGDRHDVAEYLNGHGWTAVPTLMADLYEASGRSMPVDDDADAEAYQSFSYVTATRG
jgi:methyltransferase (TIGR00027 family)